MRKILHSDINNFYASVECFLHPELRNEAVAVVGDAEKRKGIVLAKNMLAKRMGVKTGETIWLATQKCPALVTVNAHFDEYLRFSRLARQIYERYSDRVEPFGLDEAWIDVSSDKREGKEIADEIRKVIFEELGITASVGVSFNKIFAKLGSDMKKPDATTVISVENFKQKVWPLPVNELLYVGRQTSAKLERRSILTIGDLAKANPEYLSSFLGKWGYTLNQFANGLEAAPVRLASKKDDLKSVSNSTTVPRDLINQEDVKMTVYTLCESVAERLRCIGKKCTVVRLFVRDSELFTRERQKTICATSVSGDIAKAAMELFCESFKGTTVRALGVCAAGLIRQCDIMRSLFEEEELQKESLENAIDDIRRRFGQKAVFRSLMLMDKELFKLNPIDDHTIHPVSYFR